MSTYAVLGAGSWGTALALQLAYANQDVMLWDRDADHVKACQAARENHAFLPGIPFPECLQLVSDLKAAVNSQETVLLATPSHAFEAMAEMIKPFFTSGKKLVWASKGFSSQGKLLHEVAKRHFSLSDCAVLSGPSFAKEVARQLPTTVIISGEDQVFIDSVAKDFANENFRTYTNTDIAGVQVGGAIKNVLAVAVGVSDGLGFGANARAALITRGLSELMRLGEMLGAKRETMMGLSGLGDLILTCTDDQSRNRRLGLAIGQGGSIEKAVDTIGQVVESIHTVKQVYALSQQHGLDMPITKEVFEIIHKEKSPQAAVKALFERSLKSEH